MGAYDRDMATNAQKRVSTENNGRASKRTAPAKPKPTAGILTNGGIIEAIDDPHRLAREFVRREFSPADGEKTLVLYRDEFHEHNGICYRYVPTPEIRARFTRFVKAEFDAENRHLVSHPELWTDSTAPACRKVTTGIMTNAMAALQGMTLIPGQIQMPHWLDGRGDINPADVLATRSGLIVLPRLASGDYLLPPTPLYFSSNGVCYDYNPNAECPTWLRFLNSLWPDDAESIHTMQDWLGYLLLPDTRLHKLLMLIGPPRSGKGTIGRVIKGLIGESNLACPTLGSLAGPFGLWPLLGKTAGLIADARLSGRTDAIAVVEKLLSISGEDPQDIHRKNLPTLTGVRLPVRFMLMTNELPNMRDASGALTSRVILIRMTRSFLGQEDKLLDTKLSAELPGILNWALIGWDGVRNRGTLIQPESGRELLADLDDLASPIKQFIRECCHVGPEFEVRTDDAWKAWRSWCEQHGRENVGTQEIFGKDLRSALPQVAVTQPRIDGARVRFYRGIGIRSDVAGTGWHTCQTYARDTRNSGNLYE